MENFKKFELEFEDNELNCLVRQLNRSFDNNQDSFVFTCRDIYKIWSYCKGNYWKAKNNEYYNSYKLLDKFGFDKKAVSRYKNCYEKFIVDNKQTTALILNFKDFSPSKLYELLPLSNETLEYATYNKLITADMTVKQIREFVKNKKGVSNEKVIEDNTINEEEIPMAYNPKHNYEFDYFNAMTKNQLLNIIMELQKAHQALLNKKEKKQNEK